MKLCLSFLFTLFRSSSCVPGSSIRYHSESRAASWLNCPVTYCVPCASLLNPRELCLPSQPCWDTRSFHCRLNMRKKEGMQNQEA